MTTEQMTNDLLTALLGIVVDLQAEVTALTVQRDAARNLAAHLEAENAALIEAARNVVNAAGMHWHPTIDALNNLVEELDEVTP